jgi:hypothetical protein
VQSLAAGGDRPLGDHGAEEPQVEEVVPHPASLRLPRTLGRRHRSARTLQVT